MNLDFPGVNLVKIPFKYGLIAGFIYSIQINLMHLLRNTFSNFDLVSPYLSLLIIFVFIVMGIREKAKTYEGKLRYMNSLQTCLLTTLVFACISGFFMFIYNEFINTDWLDLMVDKAKAELNEQGFGPQEIREFLKPIYRRYSTTNMVEMQFVIAMVGGAIFSFFAPLFGAGNKRDKKTYSRF